jgi:hypothetical protein
LLLIKIINTFSEILNLKLFYFKSDFYTFLNESKFGGVLILIFIEDSGLKTLPAILVGGK